MLRRAQAPALSTATILRRRRSSTSLRRVAIDESLCWEALVHLFLLQAPRCYGVASRRSGSSCDLQSFCCNPFVIETTSPPLSLRLFCTWPATLPFKNSECRYSA